MSIFLAMPMPATAALEYTLQGHFLRKIKKELKTAQKTVVKFVKIVNIVTINII